MRDEQDSFDFLRKGFDLLMTRVRGRRQEGQGQGGGTRGGGEERRAHEKRAMWLKLGLDALIWADPRGEVTCSSAHTGNGLTDRESRLQLRKHGCVACFCLFPRLVHVLALQ